MINGDIMYLLVRAMSLLPSLSCVGLACVPDVLQHHFFMTAYLIDLSDKTVCVCVCVYTFVSCFWGLRFCVQVCVDVWHHS